MEEYRHHISGFFVRRDDAERALSSLVEQGLPRERLSIFAADSGTPGAAQQEGSKEVLKDVLVDGAIGTAVGTGVGALAQVALVATNVSLFFASPLIAPLAMLGWGASIGGFIGAAVGALAEHGNKEGRLADLIGDAISSGHFVLVAETRTVRETAIAREIVQASVSDYKDAGTV